MATGKQESIICSLAYTLSLYRQQNITLLDFTPDFAKDFDYLQEVKIFSSGDGHTEMNQEKVGTLFFYYFFIFFSCPTASLCSLPWRKKQAICP